MTSKWRIGIGALAALMVVGCSTAGTARIGAGEWRAVDINGLPVAEGAPVTLRLEGGRVSGNSSCNSYSGTYQLSSGERIRFSALATTRKLCPPEVMDQERRFHSILENVQSYSFYRDDSLSLIAGDGRALRFRRS